MVACLGFKLNFNRNRTEQEHVGYLRHVYELATARRIDRLKEIDRQIEESGRSWTAKNFIGSMLIDMAVPAFTKVVTNF